MWKVIFLSVAQSLFLSGGQVFMKLAVERMGKFSLSWVFVGHFFANLHMLASGICMAAATFLWIYLIKNFAFSMIYPMISISYIFGMLASVFIFHETVPLTRWLGVILIMGGVVLIVK